MPEITLSDWIENWATVQPIETYRMRGPLPVLTLKLRGGVTIEVDISEWLQTHYPGKPFAFDIPVDPLDLKVPWHTDVPPEGLGLVPYLEGLKTLKMGETQAKELRDAGKLPKVHSRGRRLFFLWHELQRYIAEEVNRVRLAEYD